MDWQLELRPGSERSWVGSGLGHAWFGDDDAAREYFERILELNPQKYFGVAAVNN